MTMPQERTRALRYGGELLIELDAANNLNASLRSEVKTILESYPTADEIEKWALDCVEPAAIFGPMLAPESDRKPAPASLNRGSTAPRDHTQALQQAHIFFRKLAHAENLTADQHRSTEVVLRHFPAGYEIAQLARLAS